MSFDVYDMLGFEIKEDDIVTGAFSYGSSAAIRIGKVKEKKIVQPKSYLSSYPPNYYLKIEWIHGRGRPDKASLISIKPGEKSQLLKVDLNEVK